MPSTKKGKAEMASWIKVPSKVKKKTDQMILLDSLQQIATSKWSN